MFSNKTLLFVLSTLFTGALASPIPAPNTGCAAVHIITARASTERPGEGIIGAVVGDVVSRSKQTVSREAVDYPALLAPYQSSQSTGVSAMKALLASKAAACPNTKIVLMGYSQGAHVSGDVLQANAPGTDKVAAVVLMGDPAHVRGESFQKGTGNARNGLFARRAGTLEPQAAKIVSFCDTGDLFCAGGASTIIHLGYATKYKTAASNFVLDKIGG
ncbi:cutinase [Collybia nuda]|uniref:Cutinase n=1 Tax=Collybia nuda TaxID=64659 RepID=A0A9P6CMG2_9AGAR|nr:cutinase [Collybia nuda]